MVLRKPTRVTLAKFYLQQCRDGDTTHVNGLEMALVAGVVTLEELDLHPAELQRYLLSEARRLAKICGTRDDFDSILALNNMLNCQHWCQGVVTYKSAEIDPERVATLLRRHAIGMAKQCLDEGTDPEILKDLIRTCSITAEELAISQEILEQILTNNGPPSRP